MFPGLKGSRIDVSKKKDAEAPFILQVDIMTIQKCFQSKAGNSVLL